MAMNKGAGRWNYPPSIDTIKRERRTEERVRSLDAHEIVEWIHLLEDAALENEDRIAELKAQIEEVKRWVTDRNGLAYNIDDQFHLARLIRGILNLPYGASR
jgi:uncharacterized protein YydD (DUF2326 family)